MQEREGFKAIYFSRPRYTAISIRLCGRCDGWVEIKQMNITSGVVSVNEMQVLNWPFQFATQSLGCVYYTYGPGSTTSIALESFTIG
jgi:hypothetical protein